MKADGTWGGQMELQAASLTYMINITIHQLGSPRWDIVNFPSTAKTIHLSYHLESHYCSVRSLTDPTINSRVPSAPPTEIKIVDTNKPKIPKADPPKQQPKNELLLTGDEYHIMDITGCKNEKFIHQLYVDNFGEIEKCVELILCAGFNDPEAQKEYLMDSANDFPSESSFSNDTPKSKPVNLPKQKPPSNWGKENQFDDPYDYDYDDETLNDPKMDKFFKQKPTAKERKEKAKQERLNPPSFSKKGTESVIETVSVAEDLGSMQI